MFKIILFLSFLVFSDNISFGEISFQVVQKGKSGRHYIWLHGDEKTAKMALDDHMHRNEGKAFLILNETREVIVKDGLIDPNRIFSSEGAKKISISIIQTGRTKRSQGF